MNTYLGIMRWLWFKISGHVLFGNAPSSVETNYSRPNTRDSFSSFSSLSELFWVSNLYKNRVNNSSLKRIQRLCFNTAWSWLLLLVVPSIQEGEPPCSLLLHVYNEDNSTYREFIRIRGSPLLVSVNNWVITSSTFGITTNLNKSDFGSRSLLSKSVAFKSPIISSLFGGFGKLSVLKKTVILILTQPRISKSLYQNLFYPFTSLSLYPYHGLWEDLVGLLLWLC